MEGDNRSAWTPQLVFWNTAGTVAGAMFGIVAILISLVALLK